MISGSVRVQVEPDTFDSVRIGTVGWKGVEPHLPLQLVCQDSASDLAVVNDVVVDDEMDAPSPWMTAAQFASEVALSVRPIVATEIFGVLGEMPDRAIWSSREDLLLSSFVTRKISGGLSRLNTERESRTLV